MHLLPYRKIVIKTRLNQLDAGNCLKQAVFTHSPPLFYTRGPMDFYARISPDRFTANRLLDNQGRGNAFIPILHGRFVQTPIGTDVHVRMYPAIINILLASILIGLLLVIFVQSFFKWLINGQTFNDILAILPIPVIVYFAMLSWFTPEAIRAEEFLNGIYENEKCA